MAPEILSAQELDRLLGNRPALLKTSRVMSDWSLLKLLASTDREALTQLMTEQHHVKGEIVFREGDTGDATYIIRAGWVAVVKGDFKLPTVIAYRGVGEMIGEMALLENRPRSASVVALEELRLLRISRENFEKLLSKSPTIDVSLLRMLSSRLRSANDVRTTVSLTEKRLTKQVSKLQTEKQELLELQRLRQETIDLIIHDLRNPLSLISGAINVLELTLPEDILKANQEVFELANGNCEHMKRLVDSLLDVAQIEADEAQLLLTETNLPDLLKKTIDRMTAFMKRDNVSIRANIPADLPTVVIDEEKIDRVVANLIDNAIKYTPHDGLVTIEAELQEKQVLVSVTNTGPTILPEDRERIFERFTQAPRGKPKTRGFGLGLAFCRLAVEAHGGRIWVEPGEGGCGNRFTFSLPLSTQPQTMAVAA